MGFWVIFWTALLLGSLIVFAGLAVVITIGGFSDVRALFRRVDAQHKEQAEASDDAPPV